MASINDLANVASAAQALNTQQAAEAEAPLRPAAAPDAAPAPAPVLAPASAPPRPAGHDEAQAAVARGALVVLEGLDRSGKTTQVKLLEQRFVELGRKAKVLRFPGTHRRRRRRLDPG